MSYGHQRLWFIEQLEPESAAYHITSAWRLTGRVNVGALEQALNAIAARHEVLRTHFAEELGTPVQVHGQVSGACSILLPRPRDATVSVDPGCLAIDDTRGSPIRARVQ